MNGRKLEKKLTCFFEKPSIFAFRRKRKQMALKLYDFVKPFMMDTLLLKLTQFEKIVSMGKTLISLENQILHQFSKLEFYHVFRGLHSFAVR